MGKKSTKGIVIAVVALIAIGFVLQTTGILGSLQSAVTPKPCDEAPYASNCVCSLGYEKLVGTYAGINHYFCESEEKFIDPADLQFEQKVIDFAETTLSADYPNCNQKQCADGTWEVLWGTEKDFNKLNRVINVECRTSITAYMGNIPARVTFDVEDGTIFQEFCNDYIQPAPSTYLDMHGPLNDRAVRGYVEYIGTITSECGAENGIVSGKFYNWRYPYDTSRNEVKTSAGVTCTVTGDTFTCDTHCPHGLDTYAITTVQYVSDEVTDVWCGRGGTLGKVEPGMYWCEHGYVNDPNVEKMIHYCDPVNGRTIIEEGLSLCKAPFRGTPDLSSIEKEYMP